MLYVIRHGETDINKADRHQGGEVILQPLNERGIAQATKLANEIKDIHIDVVFCSPLNRAKQTCEIALSEKSTKPPIIYDERLRERLYGEYNGKTNEEMNNPTFRDDFWDINNEFTPVGAETVKQLQTRVFSLMDHVKENYKDKTVLMFSHAGACRMIYIYLNGAPKDGKYRKFSIPQAEVMEYLIRNDIE